MQESSEVRREAGGPKTPWDRRIRLWTGLVLFAFLTTHLTNHALGLISLQAMEAGRVWFLAVWRSPIGTAAFYGSLLTHSALAFYSFYRRRSLRMPAWEAAQLLLGFTIPLFLIAHVVGTRFAYEWFGAVDSYSRMIHLYWVAVPAIGVKQAIFLGLAWTHGCVGIHYWLRLKPWYSKWFPLLFAAALLVGVVALLGFTQAGREVSRLVQIPDWTETEAYGPGREQRAVIERMRDILWYGYVALLVLVLAARTVRSVIESRGRTVRITYPGGREVAAPAGITVLEASRMAGIAHASVCGGRGRCSTCRIRVIGGLEDLPPAALAEQRVLERIAAPPNVRLACQLRPVDAVSVFPVLSPKAQASAGAAQPEYAAGQEREIAVLFADLRGFTRLSEKKLPYDVVFFLNRYFEVMGEAIDRAGGVINQFTGDGVMALFGVHDGPEEGCRRAIRAACVMVEGLKEMNEYLSEELDDPLRMGVGIHTGPTVVGRMGRGVALYLTAVGDTVHVASRFQDLTKEYACQLVISEQVAERAGLDVSAFPRHELAVRNRTEPIVIRTIENVGEISGKSV
jgi:adenylate cyclase